MLALINCDTMGTIQMVGGTACLLIPYLLLESEVDLNPLYEVWDSVDVDKECTELPSEASSSSIKIPQMLHPSRILQICLAGFLQATSGGDSKPVFSRALIN